MGLFAHGKSQADFKTLKFYMRPGIQGIHILFVYVHLLIRCKVNSYSFMDSNLPMDSEQQRCDVQLPMGWLRKCDLILDLDFR